MSKSFLFIVGVFLIIGLVFGYILFNRYYYCVIKQSVHVVSYYHDMYQVETVVQVKKGFRLKAWEWQWDEISEYINIQYTKEKQYRQAIDSRRLTERILKAHNKPLLYF